MFQRHRTQMAIRWARIRTQRRLLWTLCLTLSLLTLWLSWWLMQWLQPTAATSWWPKMSCPSAPRSFLEHLLCRPSVQQRLQECLTLLQNHLPRLP